MRYPRFKRREETSDQNLRGVAISLDELMRLQFLASGFSFLPRQPVHSVLNGRHASRLRGRGINFEELRGYLPGDDIRGIDWKITARAGKPHVRIFNEERDRPVWLLVDQRASMFFGSHSNMKSVTAAEAAALAAWRALAGGDRVGALVFNDEQLVEFPPQRSRAQVARILAAVSNMTHALVKAGPRAADSSMINRALEHLGRRLKHDALVCLIGDGLGLDESSRRLVTGISAHNDVLCVFIFDPLEQELPEGGRLSFADVRGQLEMDLARSREREAFKTDFEQRASWLQGLAQQHAIPILTLNTTEPVAAQVRAQLGGTRRARR